MNKQVEINFRQLGSIKIKCAIAGNILEAAANHNIFIENGCRDGRCGKCISKIQLLDSTQHEVELCTYRVMSDLEIIKSPILDFNLPKVTFSKIKVIDYQELSESKALIKFVLPKDYFIDWLAGQYVNITFDGVTRSYSIYEMDPTSRTFSIYVTLYQNGKMSAIFRQLNLGKLGTMSGPYGSFILKNKKKNKLFIGIGSGLAPMISIIDSLSSGTKTERITLITGNKFAADLPFGLEHKLKKVNWIKCLSREHAEGSSFGRITNQISPKYNGHEVYICGAGNVVRDIENIIRQNLEEVVIYKDSFYATGDTK
jgi:CDP-4-dehydro-6-deoxyglucose reductase, E3